MQSAALVALAMAGCALVAETLGAQEAQEAQEAQDRFVLATPQVVDPLRPLAQLDVAAGRIVVRAAVVGVADPLETHLGRAFDIQLSSLIRAYHARNYVLDGFALTWDPARTGHEGEDAEGSPAAGDTAGEQRKWPSVLVFRDDLWRKPGWGLDGNDAGAEYFVLFLVGESPTFGLQPKAFDLAARCATALNGVVTTRTGGQLDMDCPVLFKNGSWTERDAVLEVVGPSFSGSMQSLALTLGRLYQAAQKDNPGSKLTVHVTSPSASVVSNLRVTDWARALASVAGEIRYQMLAASLEEQLNELCVRAEDLAPRGNIVILAEESTFGGGVNAILEDAKDGSIVANCARRIRVAQFTQNVAAIRAEHSRLDRQASEGYRRLLKSSNKLLELDLSGIDVSADRPPAYHHELSSRSDELMLYGTFDALRVWVDPAIVAIVATDVRDRLFLLNEVRKLLPAALPVLLEMDFLTAHPDYRKISRGSVVIPNGETLVKLRRRTPGDLPSVTYCVGRELGIDYYAFPSDYSANMFRAALELIEPGVGNPDPAVKECCGDGYFVPPTPTQPVVTTLAGFQEFGKSQIDRKQDDEGQDDEKQDDKKPRAKDEYGSRLLASDSRLSLERPSYALLLIAGLLLTVISGWLYVHGRRHLIMVSALRNLNPWSAIREEKIRYPADAEPRIPPPRGVLRHAPALMLAFAVAVALIALTRFVGEIRSPTSELRWDLPHGRDEWALACLFLLYGCVAVIGAWRLYLWRLRYDFFLGPEAGRAAARAPLDSGVAHQGHIGFGVVVLLAMFLILLVPAIVRGVPTAVDDPWPSLVMSLLLLPLGAWFLAEFWTQAKRWSRLALILGRVMDFVATRSERPGAAARGTKEDCWPSPMELGELPQAPFSLQFRRRDLGALAEPPGDAEWVAQTRALSEGRWPFDEEAGATFTRWQARLVAEMRYAAVAVRTCAWCGILAPTAVLLGMSVYPPPSERLQTSASIALIVAGFALVMYVVLRLERHPTLSRMFTQHGDKLTLTSAVGALWPKLVAAALILVPVLFPDFLEWIYGLLRSINSLR